MPTEIAYQSQFRYNSRPAISQLININIPPPVGKNQEQRQYLSKKLLTKIINRSRSTELLTYSSLPSAVLPVACLLRATTCLSAAQRARKQLGAPSLLRVESTVCFQRKRGLPSSRLTKAGQAGVIVHWKFSYVLCALTTCFRAYSSRHSRSADLRIDDFELHNAREVTSIR